MSNYIAKVAQVQDDYTVVVNKGSADGMSVGQNYILLGVGEEIKDPDTGESLGNIELVRGKVKVSHVQEKMSTLISAEWMNPRGTKTIKRRNPILGMIGEEETEIINEQPSRLKLNSPQLGDVIKEA